MSFSLSIIGFSTQGVKHLNNFKLLNQKEQTKNN